jgi:hypothetical protein
LRAARADKESSYRCNRCPPVTNSSEMAGFLNIKIYIWLNREVASKVKLH